MPNRRAEQKTVSRVAEVEEQSVLVCRTGAPGFFRTKVKVWVKEVEEQSLLVCQTGAPSKRPSHERIQKSFAAEQLVRDSFDQRSRFELQKSRSNQCWFAEQAHRAKDRLTKEFRKAAAEELGVEGKDRVDGY